jgi:cytosine/adenosine deaminase-related metal-dependent hydrolase
VCSSDLGKIADLITVNFAQPHLAPFDMPIYRLVYNATGHDVDTVVVAGRVVMQNRKLLTVEEGEILAGVERVYRRFVERGKLEPYTRDAERLWGASRS